MYKVLKRKDVVLKVMKDTKVMESILFNPVNDGFFRMGSEAGASARAEYVRFLTKSSERWGRWGIWFEGEEVGFIMAAGVDCRLVGGIMEDYQRRGIYSAARQCVVKSLNDLGQFSITSSYHKGNKKMEELNKGVPTTPLEDGLVLNHFDPMKSVAVMEKSLRITPRGLTPRLFHISFDDNLPDTLYPALPAGSGGPKGEYTEPDYPRVSFSPSVELCFRAIYPNINHLLEDTEEPEITFTVYEAKPRSLSGIVRPFELHDKRIVHDAFITQEHAFVKPIGIKKLGKVTFKNTSDDEGLRYLPFNEGDMRYHSPFDVITVKDNTGK